MNQQILEEACEWFVRMRDGEDSPEARHDLMAWFRRSPEHADAYLEVAAIWLETRNVKVDSGLDLAARVALAREDRNVEELSLQPHRERSANVRGWHRRRMDADEGAQRRTSVSLFPAKRKWLLGVAASLLVTSVVSLVVWWNGSTDVYASGFGEQRSISLPDGSTVDLNSESRVRVQFDATRRLIELSRGQALFRVAKDPARPFVVDAGNASVRAIGTVFDVYRKPAAAIVTVVEGTVIVEEDDAATRKVGAQVHPPSSHASGTLHEPQLDPSGIRVSAGKQLIVAKGAEAEPVAVNPAIATSWTQRQLIFEFAPLSDVAEEFNRYNTRKLVVESERLRALKISAIFRSTDPGSLVRYMETVPGVEVRELESRFFIVPKDP